MKGIIFFTFLTVIVSITVSAQDTTKRKTINVTSIFKPALKNTAKLNFSADAPVIDTAHPILKYSIPVQFLSLDYQPAGLNPLALPADSVPVWTNDNYIKAGIGNVHLPYIKAGFSFGDRKNSFFNVFAEGYSAKGNQDFQDNSLINVAASGTVKTSNHLEWTGKLGFRDDVYYLYGFHPDTLHFIKDQLQQQFLTFDGQIALRNTVPTEFGLTYNPNFKITAFGNTNSSRSSEADIILNLPLQKSLNDNFDISLGFTADVTNYQKEGGATMNNNIFLVSPAVIYHNDNLALHLEMTPSWDQSDFHLLPNFRGEYTTDDKLFTLFLSLDGYYDKGSYKRFAGVNPWLWAPTNLLNTRVTEFFGGIKGSFNQHFSYLVKAGVSESRNMALFLNDSLDGKNYQVVYDDKLQEFTFHGEVSYMQGEEFTATAGFTFNNFKTSTQYKAWGLLPVEFTTTLRWQIMKDLWLKADLWAFQGAYWRYLNKTNGTGDGGFDMNAGLEFRLTRQLNLWLQMNNLFNDKYQRWNQYPVYGFNILGGVIFSFGK